MTLTGAWLLRPWPLVWRLWLLAASLYFASRWRLDFVALLLGSAGLTWACGEAVWRSRGGRMAKVATLVGVGVNLGALAVFKYLGFFVEGLDDFVTWLGLGSHLPVLELVAPLGLSFYTFQNVAYLVDVRRGVAARPRDVLDYLLSAAYLPRLAAGPILRSTEILPQLRTSALLTHSALSSAFLLVLTGLAKKWVVGGYLATHMVDELFTSPEQGTRMELWTALFAYTAQLWLDFSGYTDIARGISRLVGIELPENFASPYAAPNLGEYWRRWHMSFSRWLRDYAYFPLGGSRGSPARTALNLCVTFTLCGLWHGASWGFVLWGALHGAALALQKLWRDARRTRGETVTDTPPLHRYALGCALTLTFCALVRVYFEAPDLVTAHTYLRGLFAGAAPVGIGLDPAVLVLTALALAANFLGPRAFAVAQNALERVPHWARPALWATGALCLWTLRPYEISDTVYFAF
jgi:D-alanyl-lipoteichoic acid acyltransferase DltB (MBOAT superfamily)